MERDYYDNGQLMDEMYFLYGKQVTRKEYRET